MKKLTIVKIGGKVINEEAELDAFLKKFSALEGDKILVHGGGNIATEWQEKLGTEPKILEGRRITDANAIEVVTMVFSGLNKKITAKLQALDVQTLGVSGADLNLIKSTLRNKTTIDYGYVGDIYNVNVDMINSLINLDITLAMCALTHDSNGQLLNTNADTIASALASALSKTHEVELVYCFEQLGVLSDFEFKTVIPKIQSIDYQSLKDDGTISDGMIPKIDNAFAAIATGVREVKICHFDAVETLHSDQYSGTTLCK